MSAELQHEEDEHLVKKRKVEDMKVQLEEYLQKLQAALITERAKNKAEPRTFSEPAAPYVKKPVGVDRRTSEVKKPTSAVHANGAVVRKHEDEEMSGLDHQFLASHVDDKALMFRLCTRVLDDLLKNANAMIFAEPVDWKKLQLFEYPKIIKNPMDLGTVRKRLDSGIYNTLLEFSQDVQLIWDNAKTFNPPANPVHRIALEFETLFRRKFHALERDMKRRISIGSMTPIPSTPAVPAPRPKSEPVKKKSSKKSSMPSSSISFAEKQKLREDLLKVPPTKARPIVEIVSSQADLSGEGPQEFEVDIDKLDNSTFRKLQQYVRSVLNPSSKSKKRPSVVEVAQAVEVAKEAPLVEKFASDTDSSSSFESDLSSDEEFSSKPAHSHETSAGAPRPNSPPESKEGNGSELWKGFKVGAESDMEALQISKMDEERNRQRQLLEEANDDDKHVDDIEQFEQW